MPADQHVRKANVAFTWLCFVVQRQKAVGICAGLLKAMTDILVISGQWKQAANTTLRAKQFYKTVINKSRRYRA